MRAVQHEALGRCSESIMKDEHNLTKTTVEADAAILCVCSCVCDEVTQAARGGQDCELVDAERQLRLCLYPAEFARDGVNAYLVRPIDDHVLVVDYLNLDADRRTYNPTSLEARYLAGDFEPIPIDGNIDDYLTSFS